MNAKTSLVLGASLLALFAAYHYGRPASERVGAGDDVIVSGVALGLPAEVPFRVQSVTATTITGVVRGTIPTPPVTVPRSAVVRFG